MTMTRDILGTAVGVGSLAIVGRSARLAKDSFKKTPIKQSKRLVKGMVDLTVGTALIVPISKSVGGIE